MELQRLNQNEESDKRKRGIALKASSSFQEDIDNEDSNDEEDFSLFVKRFHKFIKTRRNQRPQNFNQNKGSQETSPTLRCYKCNQPRHIKANCLQIVSANCVSMRLSRESKRSPTYVCSPSSLSRTLCIRDEESSL